MDTTKFEENLMIYGADISRWPTLLREAANSALATNAAMQNMLAEEQTFEEKALLRPSLEDDFSFVERIIAIATTRDASLSWHQRIRLIGNELAALLPFPKPAYAFASLALMGFVMGMSTQQQTTVSTVATMSAYLYEVRGMI